jgi:opacity protein-like surface antigen
MKTILPFAIVFLFAAHVVNAQPMDDGPFKRFGIKAGVNNSHLDFTKGVPPRDIKTSRKTGFNFGFVLLVPLTGALYFQPEYAYSQMGGKLESTDTSYQLNYFSMPLLLRYQLSEKFAITAGPQADLLINGRRSVKGVSKDITHDTEERSLSAVFGAEYEIAMGISIGARYMYGLNHVGLGQRSELQEFKFTMAQLSLCARF